MPVLFRLVRLVLLVALLTTGLAAAWRLTAAPSLELARGLAEPAQIADDWTLDHLVADVGSALLLVASTCLAVLIGLSATASLALNRAPALAAACSTVTPARCRRLVAVLLGLGLASPLTVLGMATADDHHPECRVACRTHPALGGLRLPDLPVTPTRRPTGNGSAQRIVVRSGDSLWRITERRSPVGASAAQIAELTNRLYVLNRTTIGDDPDLIFPGMTLHAPEGRP